MPSEFSPVESPLTVPPLPLDFYLVGQVTLAEALRLQRRLAYEVGDFHRPRIAVLLCEHPELITVGRNGSRAHIRCSAEQLARMQVGVQWVSRGGGCVPHGPGQLAVYPIVPLCHAGWTVGGYLRRFQSGIQAAVDQFHIPTFTPECGFGIWGHSGLLAVFGIAVRNGIASHGGFLNVHPAPRLARFVDTAVRPPAGGNSAAVGSTMSSVLAERRAAVSMAAVRAAVIDSLVAAFACELFHVHAAPPSGGRPPRTAGEACVHL